MKLFKKSMLVLLVLIALLAIPLTAVGATGAIQACDPATDPTCVSQPADTGSGSFDWVGVLFKVAIAVGVVALLGERATEVLKEILRQLSQVPGLKLLAVQGGWSALLALVVAAVAIYYPSFNLAFFQQFDLFKNVDPQLVSILNTGLLWLIQNVIHQSGALDGVFKATPVSELKFKTLGKPK